MTLNPVGDNEAFSAVYWSAITNAHNLEAVIEGCAPSKGTGNWAVDVAEGRVAVNGQNYPVEAQSVSVPSANATNPRVDLVTLGRDATLAVTAGTPATDPAAPDIPEGRVVVAVVFVPAGAASITASDINDYRVLLTPESTEELQRDYIAYKLSYRTRT